MAYLRQHREYKKIICKKIIDLPEVVKLIDSTKLATPDKLLWKNVFPTYINPNTLVEKMAFITLEIYSKPDPKNPKVCVETIIEINIFADIDIQKTDDGFVRTDSIQCELFEAFDELKLEGVGYLEFKDEKPLYVSEKFSGSKLIYSITNLQRLN